MYGTRIAFSVDWGRLFGLDCLFFDRLGAGRDLYAFSLDSIRSGHISRFLFQPHFFFLVVLYDDIKICCLRAEGCGRQNGRLWSFQPTGEAWLRWAEATLIGGSLESLQNTQASQHNCATLRTRRRSDEGDEGLHNGRFYSRQLHRNTRTLAARRRRLLFLIE